MPSINVPDATGHVEISWNPENPEEVKHAKAHFEKLKAAGHIFFEIAPDGAKGDKVDSWKESAKELICEFDPKADILATKVPVGG
jgi:hypothetical protein